MERLVEEATRSGRALLHVLLDPALPETIKGKARKSATDLAKLLAELREHSTTPASKVLLDVIEATNYLDYLSEFSGHDAAERRDNVFELVAAMKEYDITHPDGSLEGFLQETSLVQDTDRFAGRTDRVVLMTLHSAKGLEFPVVFIAAMEDGILPHVRSLADDDLEEERRLCYVGITRARERLFLSHARIRYRFGKPEASIPSRFLDELPESFPKKVEIGYGESEVSFLDEPGGSSSVYDLSPESSILEVGNQVVHESFGQGVVMKVRGSGPRTRITVQFEEFGEKVLLQEFARLRKM
jgi:DNA helicase-2/ATP-dependent DNA helicase PcrA